MKHFVTVLVILVLITLFSEGLNERSGRTFPLAIIPTEENKQVAHDEAAKSELSSADLSEIHHLAKNISHSKGIYREGGDKEDLRRSIVRKYSVASESDIIKELLNMFESSKNKLILLEHMEDLVHQFDVAIAFATMGGMKIISPLLFSDDDELVISVALVLGSAMQSNPTVQKLALDQNVDKKLFDLLSHKSPVVVPRIVYAISCLLRNAPKAQEEFLSVDGVARLADILKNRFIIMNTKLKIIGLFSDLAVEQKTAKQDKRDRSDRQITEFRRSLVVEIHKHNICAYIVSFLELEDYDSHQKVVDAMLNLYGVCHKYFKDNMVKDKLKKLLKIYFPQKCVKDFMYPDIDDEIRANLYSGLVVLYEKINEGTNVSSYKYFVKHEL